jgi:hypothetical protein
MKRRGFLKGSIGTLAAGATSNAALGDIIAPNWANVSPPEMDHFLTDLDSAMDRIENEPNGGRYVTKLLNHTPNDQEALLFRKSMRSLLLVGNFGDLSIQGQVHPGVQRRLNYSAPEIDSALQEIVNELKSLSPEDIADIKLALSRDRNLGEQVLEAIHLESKNIGVPARRRHQLRVMGKRILRRLKHSPGLLIDEYVGKYEKLTAPTESGQDMRPSDRIRETRILEAKEAALRWEKMHLKETPIEYNRLQDDTDDREEKYRKRWRALGIGAIITATGALLIAITGGLDDDSEGLGGVGVVLGVTVGPTLMLIGLIIGIVRSGEKYRSK